MDIFGATRGWYNNMLTEAAFDINVCVQNQVAESCLSSMIKAVRRYNEASECLKLIDHLEQNYKSPAQNNPNTSHEN